MTKKNKKQLKKGDLVEIFWRDITSCDQWVEKNCVEQFKPKNMMAWGVIVSVDEEQLKVYTMLSADGDSNVASFPIGCLDEVTVLKEYNDFDGFLE